MTVGRDLTLILESPAPLRTVAHASALTATGIGMLVVVGWATGSRVWASFGPQYIPMAPTTALLVMLLSVSVVVCVSRIGMPRLRRIGVGAAILVCVASLVTLGDFLTGARWSYESWLVAHPDRFGLVLTGRVSPMTAAGILVLSSSALLLLRPAYYPLVGGLVSLVAGGALLVLAGYVYHAPLLYGGRTIPVALTTDLAFLSLVTAFVTAIGPSHFPLRPFWGPSARALLLRTFLPITVAIVAVTGILAHIGGQWNPALASASAVLFASVLVAMVVSRLAARIGGGLDDARLKIQVLNTELARQIEERTRQLVATQRAEARAEQQVRRLAALRMIDLAIAASMDLRITLHVVVDQVVAQLHADAVAVLLLNPHTYVLDYAAGHGFHATAIEHVQFRLGEGSPAGWHRNSASSPSPTLCPTKSMSPVPLRWRRKDSPRITRPPSSRRAS